TYFRLPPPHDADLAVPPAAVRNVAGPISPSAASAAVKNIVGPIPPISLSVAPQGRCEKCCWTYFTLGRASAAAKNIVGPIPPISPSVAPPGSLRKMLLDLFHSRPRQRCCKEYCWTHFRPFRPRRRPVPAARNVAEPISPSIAGSAAVRNAVGTIPRQPGSTSARGISSPWRAGVVI